jgi:hypothetical protein
LAISTEGDTQVDDIKKTIRRGRAEVLDTPAGRIFTPPDNAPTPDKAPILDGYLTEAEFAREIGRSVRTLARWRAIGEGPRYIRLGRQIFYRKTTAAAWLAGLEQEVA